MKVVILVPRRADHGRRDQLWEYVKGRWDDEQPDWPIHEGHQEEGPFNRSMAINRAATAAGDWDVAVIADSDSFVGKDQIEAAVVTCAHTGQMTLAFEWWNALNETMSDQIMDGFAGYWETGIIASVQGTCSSMLAVPRSLWDAVGGFDEGFIGWAGEDIAFWRACEALGGGTQRVPGVCWHLYHQSADRPHIAENIARCERYGAVANDPIAMRALIAELKAEVAA